MSGNGSESESGSGSEGGHGDGESEDRPNGDNCLNVGNYLKPSLKLPKVVTELEAMPTQHFDSESEIAFALESLIGTMNNFRW